MRKVTLLLIVALAFGGALSAQEAADFTLPAPQFLAFDIGAGLGFSFSEEYAIGTDQAGGVTNFGVRISALENLIVGLDSLIAYGGNPGSTGFLFTGLRFGYNFIPQAGATIGIGYSTLASKVAVSLGVYGDLFQKRAANGLTTGLKIRIDYFAPVSDSSKGTIVFTPAFSFGL
ncbi:MAG: hypothetical protein LBQ88_21785 [Treponema sp.]|jgi:hypothetical protein|nr:hypothetical protein [Treponema sp.]